MTRKMFGMMCAVALTGGALVTGCETKSEGERTLDKAAKVEDAGHRITKGEKMVQEGDALIARGKAAKAQGDVVGGDKLISDGESTKKQGQVLIEQGRKDRL